MGLRHPPCASVGIQLNANGRDARADAKPHASGKLRDAGDPKSADVRVFPLKSQKELLLFSFYGNIRFDAVSFEHATALMDEAVFVAARAHGLDIAFTDRQPSLKSRRQWAMRANLYSERLNCSA